MSSKFTKRELEGFHTAVEKTSEDLDSVIRKLGDKLGPNNEAALCIVTAANCLDEALRSLTNLIADAG
jgi:hypothetical protein